jgi:hypothetical protein
MPIPSHALREKPGAASYVCKKQIDAAKTL